MEARQVAAHNRQSGRARAFQQSIRARSVRNENKVSNNLLVKGALVWKEQEYY
jgi:hypothetical protein